MNKLNKRVAVVTTTAALLVGAGVSSMAATSASAATSSVQTSAVGAARTPAQVTVRTVPSAVTAATLLPLTPLTTTATAPAAPPIGAALKAAALLFIALVKVFMPPGTFAIMKAAIKRSLAAFQLFINTVPSWIKAMISGISIGSLWRGLKSVLGMS